MKVSVIKAKELQPSLEQLWESIREENHSLISPYFSASFTKCVGEVNKNTFISIIEDQNNTIGFFPFQKNILGTGKPIGGDLSDYHGMIIPNLAPITIEEVTQKIGLNTWDFDHLIATQKPHSNLPIKSCTSPALFLPHGFQHYVQNIEPHSNPSLSQTKKKRKKIERDLGPLHFEFHTQDKAVLNQLFTWKSAQYRRSQTVDVFGFDWTRELIERLLNTQSPQLNGVLSALYCKDQLIAAHFGIRSKHVLHWWFPAYNVDYKSYSPGMLLLVELLKSMSKHDLTLLDFGKGDESYKLHFMNHSTPLLEGSITFSTAMSFLRFLPRKVLNRWERFLKFR